MAFARARRAPSDSTGSKAVSLLDIEEIGIGRKFYGGWQMIFPTTADNRRAFINVGISVLTLFHLTGAHASYGIGSAVVTQVCGKPCFSIEPREERRIGAPKLSALIVDDMSVRPPVRVWSFGMEDGSRDLLLPASAAVCYGDIPPGATAEPPPTLKVGVIYSVFLNARPQDDSDPIHGYQADFCLVKTAKGITVLQLRPASGLRRDPVFCPEHWTSAR